MSTDSSGPRALSYRPDIDGLRAVAVLAVIAFHAFPTWVPGGFAGVDVFFVISGYLISQQLFAECDRQEFSIAAFYARRVRRIVPALTAVLMACAIAGWIILTPAEFGNLQLHIAASAFFSNNILLWFGSGYFEAPAKTQPLLHLWSLGVEEQFYIVWPWLVFWCWRRGLNRTTVIGVVTIVSFVWSAWLVSNGHTAAAFYLPQSRLWQLAAGGWLASVRGSKAPSPVTANAISIGGAFLIPIAFVLAGRAAPNYPGVAALLPTGAAALILAAGPMAWVNRFLLSTRALVAIGLISYPLYLWHWPLLSFLSISEVGAVPQGAILTAVGIAFVLAALSYLLLEKPIRSWVLPSRPTRAAAVAAALGVVGVTSLVAVSTGTLLPPARVAAVADDKVTVAWGEPECKKQFPIKAGYCQEWLPPPAPVTAALWGDSHAAHFFPGLGARLARKGEDLVQFGAPGCPPIIGLEQVKRNGDSRPCEEVNGAAFASIVNSSTITEVVLAFRGGIYDVGDVPGATATRIGASLTNEASFAAALVDTVGELQNRHKHVTLVLPTPRLNFEIGECLGRPWSLFPRTRREPCAVPRADVLAQQTSYRRAAADLAQRFGATIVDPLTALCDERLCYAVAGAQPLYNDNNHLGIAGSAKVAAIFPLGR